nr:MAG TPA: hypothetical protein [Caudoviricetes sp.]
MSMDLQARSWLLPAQSLSPSSNIATRTIQQR